MSVSPARFVAGVGKFDDPESVRYDAEQDLVFISNMNGYGSVKDGNGYISRMSAADPGSVSVFIRGGTNGVTLHSPKGLAIQGDTLWVADIDDGSILFTSWADSTLHLIDRSGAKALIREIPESADFDIDTRRQRVAIPLAMLGMVQLWSIDGVSSGPPPAPQREP